MKFSLQIRFHFTFTLTVATSGVCQICFSSWQFNFLNFCFQYFRCDNVLVESGTLSIQRLVFRKKQSGFSVVREFWHSNLRTFDHTRIQELWKVGTRIDVYSGRLTGELFG
jgi:hypothetical protein